MPPDVARSKLELGRGNDGFERHCHDSDPHAAAPRIGLRILLIFEAHPLTIGAARRSGVRRVSCL
jgi:hypothetical protein